MIFIASTLFSLPIKYYLQSKCKLHQLCHAILDNNSFLLDPIKAKNMTWLILSFLLYCHQFL